MGLLSLFHREADASAGRRAEAGDGEVGSVEQLRTRARRRLIGSAILLGVAVAAFSLLFETHPRPEGRTISVEVQRRDAAPGTAAGTVIPTRPAADRAAAEKPSASPVKVETEVITESAAEAARDKVAQPAAPSNATSSARAAADEGKTAMKADIKADTKSDTKAETKSDAKPTTDADRAKALLEDRAATAAGKDDKLAKATEAKPGAEKATPAAEVANEAAGRFVVQVGAFADVEAARAVRLRVEKLGMKTYTQVVQTAEGRRIRVRVGPYASRGEADKALSRLTADGLKPAVLTL